MLLKDTILSIPETKTAWKFYAIHGNSNNSSLEPSKNIFLTFLSESKTKI